MKKMIALILLAGTAQAAQNAIPSCYQLTQIESTIKKPDTELFVIVDQTMVLDGSLKKTLAENVRPFLKAGNAFSITQFSAYTQGHYADVLVSAELSPSLPDAKRAEIGKPQLQKFDLCLKQQQALGTKLAGEALGKALAGSSTTVSRSDILTTLKEIAVKAKASPAQNKVILLSSDMLENSTISSFYSKQAVRKIDPQVELKVVQDNKLFTDFGGARVYVLGAGTVVEDAQKGTYRDPKTMQALESFWGSYFQKSNAKLVEFGKPALLNPVR